MTDTRKSVLILEDTPSRVEWVQENFPTVEVVWKTTVADFLQALISSSCDFSLIVLDHDLGANPLDMAMGRKTKDAFHDINGHSGTHAVNRMPLCQEVPILIWSGNFEKATLMEKTLRQRGFLRVSKKPVDYYPQQVKDFFQNLLGL